MYNKISKKNIKFPNTEQQIAESIVSNYKVNKPVTLSSGKRSTYYYDIKSLLLNNLDWNQLKNLIIKDLKSKFPEMSCVAGYGIGGIVLTMRIADCSEFHINPLIIRKEVKEYGLLKQVEGHCFNGSPRVVIVDDVCTTGKNFRAAEKILRANRIKTLGNYVLLKRKESKFKCESFISI
jgi:orotate phosphoribosyltransferase